MQPTRFVPLLGLSLILGCSASAGGGGMVPRHFDVSPDARNPIVIVYTGATKAQMTNIVAEMASDVPINLAQVVPAQGLVETEWADIAAFNLGAYASEIPLVEQQVIYEFEAQDAGSEGILQIAGFYQPDRPPGAPSANSERWNKFIPTSHPGYQLMLQFKYRLEKQLFPQKGVTVVAEADQPQQKQQQQKN